MADAWHVTWRYAGLIVLTLRELATHTAAWHSLAGPLGIGKASVDAARSGFTVLLGLIALLSINVAVFNLLPIPILDGGQVLVNSRIHQGASLQPADAGADPAHRARCDRGAVSVGDVQRSVPGLQRPLFAPLRRSIPAAPHPRRRVRADARRGTPLCARLAWATLVATTALIIGSSPAAAQAAYVRFDVTAISDTTFTFAATDAHWVKRGQKGLVVDPSHGDELIAKFRVTRIHHGAAMAVVTGQTARLTTSDVALLRASRPALFHARLVLDRCHPRWHDWLCGTPLARA